MADDYNEPEEEETYMPSLPYHTHELDSKGICWCGWDIKEN